MKNNATPQTVECKNESNIQETPVSLLKYLIIGMLFGIVFVKAEIVSWYRIYEMFHFQSFHMYGVIGSAVVVGLISMQLIKKYNIKTLDGEAVIVTPKKFSKGVIIGGLLFGIGWAVTGACPGPIYAQIGAGYPISILTLLGALVGTYVYGLLIEKLPH